MKASLRLKLIASFMLVVTIVGAVATLVGIRVIKHGIVRQAQEKVRLDLNSAREIYRFRLQQIVNIVAYSSIRGSLKNAIVQEDRETLYAVLHDVRQTSDLDILTITDATGKVVLRARNPAVYGDFLAENKIIAHVLATGTLQASTQILSQHELQQEGQDLVEQARIPLIDTPKAIQRAEEVETSGMVLSAAAPLLGDDGTLLGVLYGGTVINRNFALVDEIRDTVYQDAVYQGKLEGTATIFLGNLRISTNVMDQYGQRAIGTQVSAEVHEQVLNRGERWIDRAFVVNDWYITAYEPLKDIEGKIIGILYVGMLEQRFTDMTRNTTFLFLGITLSGAVIALIVAYGLAIGFLRPIKRLVTASHELSTGNFLYRLDRISPNELGELEQTFNFMASKLKARDDDLKEQTLQQLIQSEKLAAVGRLAAGVAHQLNNPLTGILTYGSLLLKSKAPDDPEREDLQMIVDETLRCRNIVTSLLGFSRQSQPQKEVTDINLILSKALGIIKNQGAFREIQLLTDLADDLPDIVLDSMQIQEVFLNIMINAIDAMPTGGELRITTGLTTDRQMVRTTITDTGSGIVPDHLDKIFDPFFTTKDASKGTGLGLAVTYGIIEKHRGHIRIESSPGQGTTCIIELPVQPLE